MFAVIKTGGKQYKVEPNRIIRIEKIEGEPGSEIEFNEILMIGEFTKPSVIGTPVIQGAAVKAKILEQSKSDKVLVFKKKRRQNYRRTKGHRQEMTSVQILDIKRK
ncbi:MAG: 50S ribosomal protein L21 [Rickettsiaceae bacterium]|nr:50S ribosomal protein L21 [Rickettsiaceae bacterium]